MSVLAPGHLAASAVSKRHLPSVRQLSIAHTHTFMVWSLRSRARFASLTHLTHPAPTALSRHQTFPPPDHPHPPLLPCRAAALVATCSKNKSTSTQAHRQTYHDDVLAGLGVLGLVDLDVQMLKVAGERATLALDGDDTSLDIDGDTFDDLALRGGVDPPVTSGGHGSYTARRAHSSGLRLSHSLTRTPRSPGGTTGPKHSLPRMRHTCPVQAAAPPKNGVLRTRAAAYCTQWPPPQHPHPQPAHSRPALPLVCRHTCARESPKKRLSRISLSPTNSSPRTRRLFGQWSEHDR